MVFDRDAEIARLMGERARIDVIVEYLRGLPNNGAVPSDAPVSRQSEAPQSEPPMPRGRSDPAKPEYGPGLKVLALKFLREKGPHPVGDVVAAIRAEYPNAPADSVRAEVWRLKKRGTVVEEGGVYRIQEDEDR